ncbi:SPOSA6832_04725, partial [Sporobolomyces salmonicolor]
MAVGVRHPELGYDPPLRPAGWIGRLDFALSVCWESEEQRVLAGGASRSYIPLLALTWAISVACLGLSASIIAEGNSFPASDFHGVIIQSAIFLIGAVVAPTVVFFGAACQFIFLFLGFLQAIVAAGSTQAIIHQYGYPDHKSLYRGWEGMSFVLAFFLLFTAVWAGLCYATGQAAHAKPVQEKEVHF